MRSIQQVFDTVIAHDLYNEHTEYMCIALDNAYSSDVISYDERIAATEAINEYIQGSTTLRFALLKDYDVITDFPERLAIYRNWEGRPKLAHPTVGL